MATVKTILGKVSLTPKGEYNSETAYMALDIISWKGSSYLVLKPFTGIEPAGDNNYTMLIAAKGDQGDPFTSEDFTEEQWAALKGEKGDLGKGFRILGYYETVEELITEVTSPEAGDAYGVGIEEPFTIYVCDGVTGDWIDNGPLQGAQGFTGKSAYESFVEGGGALTEEEFNEVLTTIPTYKSRIQGAEERLAGHDQQFEAIKNSVGQPDGIAQLDGSGHVPSSQLPSYVDDVLEFPALAQFPQPGESGKIYVDTTSNLTYRWSGTGYVEISPSIALGETASTAYAGDKGRQLRDDLTTLQQNTVDLTNPQTINGPKTFTQTPKVGENQIWHAGNQGSGSGLDADKLDGLDSTNFAREYTGYMANAYNYYTGVNNAEKALRVHLPFTCDANSNEFLPSQMFSFTLRIYAGYRNHNYRISGYAYITTGNWYSPEIVALDTDTEAEATFGVLDNKQLYISLKFLGELNYMGLALTDFLMGYNVMNVPREKYSFEFTDETPNIALQKTLPATRAKTYWGQSDKVTDVKGTMWNLGHLYPATDSTSNIGSYDNRFGNGYFKSLYISDLLYTGGKTSAGDGRPGCIISERGRLYLSGNEMVNPSIYFYMGEATTPTSYIEETTAGILSIPNKLVVGKKQTTDTTHVLTVEGTSDFQNSIHTSTILPRAHNSFDLGSATNRFKSLYLANEINAVGIISTEKWLNAFKMIEADSGMTYEGFMKDFRNIVFDTTGSVYGLKVFRSNITGLGGTNGCLSNYSPGLAFGAADTQAYISIAYNSPAHCYVGGGVNEGLNWVANLYHNKMSLVPADHRTYYLGNVDHRYVAGYFSDGLYTGEKESMGDGRKGTLVGSGLICLSNETPVINFNKNNAAAVTSNIVEGYAGILSIPNKLAVGLAKTEDNSYVFQSRGPSLLEGKTSADGELVVRELNPYVNNQSTIGTAAQKWNKAYISTIETKEVNTENLNVSDSIKVNGKEVATIDLTPQFGKYKLLTNYTSGIDLSDDIYDLRIGIPATVGGDITINLGNFTNGKDGMEYILSIYSEVGSCTCKFPTAYDHQTDEEEWIIEKGRVGELSIRYVWGKYILKAI